MGASDHALVVGINGYSKLARLEGAEADAVSVRDWLVDPLGGAVPAENVSLILSSDYPSPPHPAAAQPRTDDIRSELERLVDQGGETIRLGHRLYLYLAGHGIGPSFDESALLMANASLQVLHHVPGTAYGNAFCGSTLFDEVVLIMDCCRDHMPRPPLFDLGLPPIAVPNASPGFFFAFATRWSLQSREGRDDQGRVRGHFTRALIEALSQPDASAATVREYVPGRLRELAKGRGGYFEPEFRAGDTIVDFGDGARHVHAAHCLVDVTFDRRLPGVEVRILGGDERVVAAAPTDTSPWTLPLPRGLYELTTTRPHAGRVQISVPASGRAAFHVE